MLAADAPGAHLPIAGVFASWSHATTPNEFLRRSLGRALVDDRHTAHPGRRAELGKHLARDGRNLGGSGTVRRGVAAEQVGEGVLSCASSPEAGGGGDRAERPNRSARDEEGNHEPTDEPEGRLGVVEEPATGDEGGRATRPLGHEPRARGREPRPGEDQPYDKEHEAPEQLQKLAADAARLSGRVEVGEQADAGEERDDPCDPAGCGSMLVDSRRAVRSGHGGVRGERDTTAAIGTPTTTRRTSIQCSERSPWREGRTGERDVVEQRPEHEEEGETDCHARSGRDHCLHGRDHRNLMRRGADEAHGGEALLSPRGRQPAGGGDQDEHRQQERDGSADQDPLQNRSAPDDVLWQA